MQINKDYEPQINLKDLLFHILYRWRSILVVALIASVLLGGYKFLSMRKELQSEKSVQQLQQGVKTKEELELNRKIEEKKRQVEELDDYLRESIYINLNPQGIWTASCKYLIKADTSLQNILVQESYMDPVDSILPLYVYPLADATEEELLEVFETNKPEYANELVNVEINTEENTISITAKGITKEFSQKALDYIRKKIESISANTEKNNPHELISLGSGIVYATYVTSTKDALIGRKTALTTALNQYRTELQNLNEKAELYKTEGITKKEIVKFALIGFFVGIFLMLCIYAFHYIFRDKLASSDMLANQYSLPIFGEFKKSSSIHNNKGLDRLFSKWELGKNHTDTDTIYNNICALINEQQEADSVLLISTLKEDKLMPIKEALSTRSENKTIEAKGCFLTNSEAIADATKASVVILVEEKNTSSNKDIERMAETLMIGRANVIGAIVL